MSCITGVILNFIAVSEGYYIYNWQWWAWVVIGSSYVTFYEPLKNSKIIFKYDEN